MRTLPIRASICAVDGQRNLGELFVRIVVGSDPVRGTATLPTGEHNEFWGWLELAEIVQTATRAETGSNVARTGSGGLQGPEG